MENRAFFYVDGIPTKGQWFDMDTTDSYGEVKDEMIVAGLIGEEYDGDILCADSEGLAREFHHFTSDIFDFEGFVECRDCCEWVEEEAKAAFISCFGEWSANGFEEAYSGQYDNDEDFAENLAEDTGMLHEMPENLRCYFDFESFARDLMMSDYTEENGYYFRRDW